MMNSFRIYTKPNKMMNGDPTDQQESNITMFAKFQHHHQQQYHQLHHHLSQQEHQIQLEEHHHQQQQDESRSSSIGGAAAEGNISKKSKKEPEINYIATTSGGGGGGGGGGDSATIEVVKRPRGRPPGSKNKPKPQVLFLSTPRDDTDYSSIMQPLILEVPGGVNILESIAGYGRQRNIGVSVLTGSGTVSNVSLRQPSTTIGGANVVSFHGRFDILSISATFLPPSSKSTSLQSSLATNKMAAPAHFTIMLAGPQGQIVGGSVMGTLLAATTVFLVTASFTTPSYHRLPIEEDGVVCTPHLQFGTV